MGRWLSELDRLLRGELTRVPELRGDTVRIPARGLAVLSVILAMLYGVCMGCFALFNRQWEPALLQLTATTIKLPALFLLTLLVTFPSLYVFNALVGSRLRMMAVLQLLVGSLAVNVTVLASFGPIVAFFAVCTTNYSFMVLLNVLMFGVSGALGLAFLLQTLHRMTVAQSPPAASPQPQVAPAAPTEPVEAQIVDESSALDWPPGYVLGRHVKKVFACWVVLFGLVGAQMGWVLRPFVGHPDSSFAWIRQRHSNFFEAVWHAWLSLFM